MIPRRYFVYIVQCADGTLYTGYTTDPDRRLAEHNAGTGRGARYTRARRPVTLVYQEMWDSRSVAQRREVMLKRMTRDMKLALIAETKTERGGC